MSEGRLIQSPFYRDSQFAVALWEGDVGDSMKINVREPAPRSSFPCLTVCLRGQLQMYSPSGAEKWRYLPGDTSDSGGDFDEVGVWEWKAMQPITQEICFSALDDRGKECEDIFPREVIDLKFGEKCRVKADCLLSIARGGVVINVKELRAPHFALLQNDIEATANYSDTRLVVVRRQ